MKKDNATKEEEKKTESENSLVYTAFCCNGSLDKIIDKHSSDRLHSVLLLVNNQNARRF